MFKVQIYNVIVNWIKILKIIVIVFSRRTSDQYLRFGIGIPCIPACQADHGSLK